MDAMEARLECLRLAAVRAEAAHDYKDVLAIAHDFESFVFGIPIPPQAARHTPSELKAVSGE